ncbi:unnamed protein product [Leuciscus chuanchicus]
MNDHRTSLQQQNGHAVDISHKDNDNTTQPQQPLLTDTISAEPCPQSSPQTDILELLQDSAPKDDFLENSQGSQDSRLQPPITPEQQPLSPDTLSLSPASPLLCFSQKMEELSGVYLNHRMTYPLMNSQTRSDEAFARQEDEEHHHGPHAFTNVHFVPSPTGLHAPGVLGGGKAPYLSVDESYPGFENGSTDSETEQTPKRRPESRPRPQPLPISATLPSLPPAPLSDIAVDMGQESLDNTGQETYSDISWNVRRESDPFNVINSSAHQSTPPPPQHSVHQSTPPPPQHLSPVFDINMGFPYSHGDFFIQIYKYMSAQLHGLLLLENLKQQVAQLATTVNLLMAKVNNGLQPAAFEWSGEFQFPLESDAELDRFEAWLADPANDRQKHALVNTLSAVGGVDLKRVTWNILSYLFSCPLSRTINWKGVNKKRAFHRMASQTLLSRK